MQTSFKTLDLSSNQLVFAQSDFLLVAIDIWQIF